MLGLAKLAAALAHKRVYHYDLHGWMPGKRFPEDSFGYAGSATAEYYRICDRITRGEKP